MTRSILCALLIFLAGCHVPARMFWAPDGTRGVWSTEHKSVLMNVEGKTLRGLSDHAGGFAWSADSKILYFSAAGSSGQATTQPQPQCIYKLSGDSVTTIARLPDNIEAVFYLLLSPDQKWLAALATGKESSDQHFDLFAVPAAGGELRLLGQVPVFTMCFTGPNRLTYLQANAEGKAEHLTGKIVETSLDSGETTELLAVLPSHTPWLMGVGDDLFFTAYPRSFPGQPLENFNDQPPYKLYQFARTGRTVHPICDDVGPMFAPSPDGKRILFEKVAVAGNKIIKREMAIMNINGSDPHMLRDVTGFDNKPPMWPTWRDNQSLVFLAETPPKPGSDNRMLYDVAIYRLDGGRLVPEKTLSADWPAELKPFFKTEAPATTQATQP